MVVSGSIDSTARLWSVERGTELATLAVGLEREEEIEGERERGGGRGGRWRGRERERVCVCAGPLF